MIPRNSQVQYAGAFLVLVSTVHAHYRTVYFPDMFRESSRTFPEHFHEVSGNFPVTFPGNIHDSILDFIEDQELN